MKFGTFLNTIRENKFSQRELASKVGISHTYVSKIENNTSPPPNDEIIIRMAEILNCNPDLFLVAANRLPLSINNNVNNMDTAEEFKEYFNNLLSNYKLINSKIIPPSNDSNIEKILDLDYLNSSFVFEVSTGQIVSYNIKSKELFYFQNIDLTNFNILKTIEFVNQNDVSLSEYIQNNSGLDKVSLSIITDKLIAASGRIFIFEHNNILYCNLIIFNDLNLEQKNNYFFKFFDSFYNFPVPFYVVKINDDNTFGNYISVNKATIEVLGYSGEELLDISPYDTHDEISANLINTNLSLLLKNGNNIYNVINVTKKGDLIPFEIHASISHYLGNRYILASAIDRRPYYREINRQRKGSNSYETQFN